MNTSKKLKEKRKMLRLVLISLAIASASAIRCAPDICARERCAAVTAENCGGKIVHKGGFCGCCDVCIYTLDNIINAGTTSTVSCARRLQEIQAASANGMPLLGQPVPTCAADGRYAPRQCEGSVCYCVDPYGNRIQGYSVNIGQSANMDCQCARDQYTYMQTGLNGRLFNCTQSGSYQRYECTGSVCYCVDNLGNMLAGTTTVNIDNIGALRC